MKTKLILYASISSLAIIMKVFWLSLLVCGVTFIDMCFGVFLVRKLKQEDFSFGRFIEGFLKMVAYIAAISFAYILSETVFNGELFEIEDLPPKILTMVFLILETSSIDKKRQKLGKKPILQVIRSVITVFKELRTSVIPR